MLTFHPLYWSLIALFLAVVHPTSSHPIRTSKWIKTTQFEDRDNRGVWKVFEKHGRYNLHMFSQASSIHPESASKIRHDTNLERGQSGRLYKRDTTLDKSVVSVLVPNRPISERLYRHWKHPQAEDYEYPWKTAASTKHYGEVLGHTKAKTGATEFHRQETESSPSSVLSSGSYISFFSYRISFPFLKSAPVSFTQFPLPGIFTTIMILLALVWIAVLTIGLVEVGNYLWNRGRAAPLAGEIDDVGGDDSTGGSVEFVKEPFQVLVVPRIPRRETVRLQNENDELLSSSSESDSELESETNYRLP